MLRFEVFGVTNVEVRYDDDLYKEIRIGNTLENSHKKKVTSFLQL